VCILPIHRTAGFACDGIGQEVQVLC